MIPDDEERIQKTRWNALSPKKTPSYMNTLLSGEGNIFTTESVQFVTQCNRDEYMVEVP